jgi:hypothetical protein
MIEALLRVLAGSLVPHFGVPYVTLLVFIEMTFVRKDILWHFGQYTLGFMLQVEAIDGGWSPFFWGRGVLQG